MAKIIELGLINEDDPMYFNGYIIGPVLVSRSKTKPDKDESEPSLHPTTEGCVHIFTGVELVTITASAPNRQQLFAIAGADLKLV